MLRDWEANVRITGKAANLLWYGLAPNTHKVYQIGQATFERFAVSHGFSPPFPVQFQVLAQFIAATAEETSVETAKSYIAHIKSHHIDQGYSTEIFNECIKRILRGAARKYGNKSKRERLEITKKILEAILQNLGPTHDDVNLRAAFCTAFAGFLHMGELIHMVRLE